RLGPQYPGGTCAWVAPAVMPGDRPAVLKISWPHLEAAGEAEALRRWDGRGAARLYRHDPERWALLLERCDPGTQLGEAPDLAADARLQAAARVLEELHDAPVPRGTGIDRLGARLGEWADLTEERMDR